MYEKRHHPLVPFSIFVQRVLKNLVIGCLIILGSLGLGMLGYHHFEDMTWVAAYENAAMILSGMGPVDELHTDAGRLFAGTYALFSGIVFLVVIAIIVAPLFHRFLHKFLIHDRESK